RLRGGARRHVRGVAPEVFRRRARDPRGAGHRSGGRGRSAELRRRRGVLRPVRRCTYNEGINALWPSASRRTPVTNATARPGTLKQLRDSGWRSRSVKQEIRDNFLRQLRSGDDLFPGIIGYENTVIPEINLALIAGHDLLFL